MPMADAHTSTDGFVDSFESASTRRRVPCTRLSRIFVFACGVQRCATGSPARCTIASALTMLCRREALDQSAADESGCAGNGDVHVIFRISPPPMAVYGEALRNWFRQTE